MGLQEKIFVRVEAWRSSGMTKHEFIKDKVTGVPVIFYQRKEDYNKSRPHESLNNNGNMPATKLKPLILNGSNNREAYINVL